MLNAQEVKSRITNDNIITILLKLGTHDYIETNEEIISNTVCHHGCSHKLYYYKDTRLFRCYTDCGDSFDIIELVCRNKNYSFRDAISWLCIQLNFSTIAYGFSNSNNIINDWQFINNIRSKKKKNTRMKHDYYDKNILNIFQKMYLQDWIDEGISIESMYKYNIMYSTLQQKIIIPHYDIDNNLMGIRARATIEEEIINYGKYSPFQMHKVTYSHPLSQNLYGLNINKETIRHKKKIMLVESEKAVMQCDTMFGADNFTVGLCGNSFHNYQRDLILSLDVQEVIIALDKQFHSPIDVEADRWSKHIRNRIINKLAPYVTVTVLWDMEDLLHYKSSPTDFGKEILLKLMDKKIYTGCM